MCGNPCQPMSWGGEMFLSARHRRPPGNRQEPTDDRSDPYRQAHAIRVTALQTERHHRRAQSQHQGPVRSTGPCGFSPFGTASSVCHTAGHGCGPPAHDRGASAHDHGSPTPARGSFATDLGISYLIGPTLLTCPVIGPAPEGTPSPCPLCFHRRGQPVRHGLSHRPPRP